MAADIVWSDTVRYAEVDQQGIVFNAHYLTWADEAMGAFCLGHGLLGLAERLHVVASSLTWSAPARWGDSVDVAARCTRVGTSSLVVAFTISVADRLCCTVETTYVHAAEGRATPLPEAVRQLLN